MEDDEADYLRRREVAERAAAAEAACMARTAHEDLAETYAERADALKHASADQAKALDDLCRELDRLA